MQQKLVILFLSIPLLLAGGLNTLVNTGLLITPNNKVCTKRQNMPPADEPTKECATTKTCSPCHPMYVCIVCSIPEWAAFRYNTPQFQTPVINHYHLEYYQSIWQPPDRNLA